MLGGTSGAVVGEGPPEDGALSGQGRKRRRSARGRAVVAGMVALALIGLADTVVTQVVFSAYAASGMGANRVSAPPALVVASLAASACVGLMLALAEKWHGEGEGVRGARTRAKRGGEHGGIRERLSEWRISLGMAGGRWTEWARTAGATLAAVFRRNTGFSVWSVTGGWLVALALGVSLVADLGATSAQSRPAAQWAWVGSVALLVVAAGVIEHGARVRDGEHGGHGEETAHGGNERGEGRFVAQGGGPWWVGWVRRRWRDGALVGLLIAGALALRLPDLTGLPYVVHGDEASCGLEALRWLRGGVPSLLSTGWYGLPVAGYGLPALVMRFAGADLWGLRLSSVILGTLSIVLLYALAREFAGRRVAFVAAALMTVSHLHIQFSRMGIHYIHGMLVVELTLWLLARALRRGGLVAAVLAGAAMSLSLQVYFSARIVFVIVPLFLLALAAVRGKTPLSERWGQGRWLRTVGWLALGLFVAVGPLAVFFQQDVGALTGRPAEVLILNLTAYKRQVLHAQFGTTDLWTIVGRQLAAVPLIPGGLADQSLQYGARYAMLDPLVAALALAGFWYAVWTARRPLSLLLVAWVVSVVTFGGVLTVDLPWWPRLLAMLPALCLLAALSLDQLLRMAGQAVAGGVHWTRVRRAWSGKAGGRVALAALGALAVVYVVGYSLGETMQHYYVDYPRSVRTDTYRTRYTDLAYYGASLPAGTRVVLFDNGDLLLDYATIQFLAPGLRGTRVTTAAELKRVLAARVGPVVVIVPLTNAASFGDVLAEPGALPVGTFHAVRDVFGVTVLYTYTIM